MEKLFGSPREISILFGLNVGSLANMRSLKKGPRFFKSGRKVVYRLSDVETWITENPVLTFDSLPTSQGV